MGLAIHQAGLFAPQIDPRQRDRHLDFAPFREYGHIKLRGGRHLLRGITDQQIFARRQQPRRARLLCRLQGGPILQQSLGQVGQRRLTQGLILCIDGNDDARQPAGNRQGLGHCQTTEQARNRQHHDQHCALAGGDVRTGASLRHGWRLAGLGFGRTPDHAAGPHERQQRPGQTASRQLGRQGRQRERKEALTDQCEHPQSAPVRHAGQSECRAEQQAGPKTQPAGPLGQSIRPQADFNLLRQHGRRSPPDLPADRLIDSRIRARRREQGRGLLRVMSID